MIRGSATTLRIRLLPLKVVTADTFLFSFGNLATISCLAALVRQSDQNACFVRGV